MKCRISLLIAATYVEYLFRQACVFYQFQAAVVEGSVAIQNPSRAVLETSMGLFTD